jgi:(1->4)-alpha-D-glucan 1-alpha-D-glucosylmutase
MQLNAKHHLRDRETAPDANEEYLLYQTLLGAWPIDPYTAEEFADFVKRVQAYMQKAMREAKLRTSWIRPNEAHELAVGKFIDTICDPSRSAEFLGDFRPFQRSLARLGQINSLAQTLLKLASPGAPDTYQGTELWDLSLVDPDNRRPVDYTARQNALRVLEGASAKTLVGHLDDGRAKLRVTTIALRCRRDHPGLFSRGEYIPIQSSGAMAENVFAFARRDAGWIAIVAIPRLVHAVSGHPWKDTQLNLPAHLRSVRFQNLFTGENTMPTSVGKLFEEFPVALLLGQR